jgi:anthranilate synthase component I
MFNEEQIQRTSPVRATTASRSSSQLPADLDTPLSIYLKLANEPYTYLLESVEGGERFGRYSFIGLPADRVACAWPFRQCRDQWPAGRAVQLCRPAGLRRAVPGTLQGGAGAGHAALSRRPVRLFRLRHGALHRDRAGGTRKPDDINTPDILLMLTDELAVVDNLSGKLTLIVYADPLEDQAYLKAHRRLDELTRRLSQAGDSAARCQGQWQRGRSEFGEDAFKAAVARAKQYILDGDIMQVVLSQRMSRPFHAHPLSLYRALRGLNPSPYMFYYDMGGFMWSGSSPEILVRLEARGAGPDTVTVRPIAGTRPRGATRAEDERLEAGTAGRSEGTRRTCATDGSGPQRRGRVAQIGSVKVTENMSIERYSHVMHIVSNVEGKLKPGLNAMDVLRATFPAGTVSGAPKVRAMEIIDELEPPSAASMPARSAMSASMATWTWPSPSAPPWSRTTCSTSRPAPASSPTRCRKANGGNPQQGACGAARRGTGEVILLFRPHSDALGDVDSSGISQCGRNGDRPDLAQSRSPQRAQLPQWRRCPDAFKGWPAELCHRAAAARRG